MIKILFIMFFMTVIYSIPSSADTMDEINYVERIEDRDMREQAAFNLFGEYQWAGDLKAAELFLEYLGEEERQDAYMSISGLYMTGYWKEGKKDCVKAKKYMDLLLDPEDIAISEMGYQYHCP